MGAFAKRSLLLRSCECFVVAKARSLVFNLHRQSLWHMAAKPISKMSTAYEESVARLNALQSNAATIQESLSKTNQMLRANVAETKWCLEKCNIKLDDIDRLNVVHVSGTKGKGSTCAFIESILRQFGFKTGFYSSPHLIHVRERIRINGRPISEEEFVRYFQHVYSCVEKAIKESNGAVTMPAYFKFLTILAFYVFVEEKVDVAVVEVGIGGEYDCTNIIQNPVVCGVTTLDYDHMALLGSTIESIAWQKAGIFKSDSVAVVSDQEKAAMQVLRERAAKKDCLMRIAPPFSAYDWPVGNVECGIAGIHQHLNVTLALQLTRLWLEKVGKFADIFEHSENTASSSSEVLPGFVVPQKFLDGIRLCQWPGRSQIIRRGLVTFYLDGAHTPKSLDCCIEWFSTEEQKANSSRRHDPFRILLFHCTADRNPAMFLPKLKKCGFSLALFCPTRLKPAPDIRTEHINYNYSDREQLAKVANHAAMWRSFNTPNSAAEEYDCIEKAVERIEQLEAATKDEIVVLVTGSLHLVGGVLAATGCHV